MTDTATEIAAAYGLQRTEPPVRPKPEPEPRPKSIAEILYPHLVPNQKGKGR